jgi:hypothetical protein
MDRVHLQQEKGAKGAPDFSNKAFDFYGGVTRIAADT